MGSLIGDIASAHRWLPFRNDSGETIYAWTVCASAGSITIDGKVGLRLTKPTADWRPFYPVSGPFDVEAGGEGLCTLDIGKPILIGSTNSALDTPGRIFGVAPGSFSMSINGQGFRSCGVRTPEGFLLAYQYAYHLLAVKGHGAIYNTRNVATGVQVSALSYGWGSDGKTAGSSSDDHFAVCYDSGLGGAGPLSATWFGGEAKG